jgi:hypothetical protein
VTSLSPPSPSSFDTPFCSSFTETSSDSNPFSGATQGPFSPFSPLFASPTSYSSTVIPSTGAGTPSSLFSLSASSAPSAIDVDLIGSESGNHGSRYYYGAPFPEIEAFEAAGEKKLDYLNVDVIVVPKEESSANNGNNPGKAASDPSSPTRSGRGGRGSGRGRGRSGGLGRSTEGDNARGTLTASRGSSSTTTTTTASSGSAERGTRSGSARSKGAGSGGRAITATHPVYDASQGASPGSTLPPYVPPKIRPAPVKSAAASPPRRARPAAAGTSVGAPKTSTSKRTSATTPTPTLEEAKRSEDEYTTAELLMSLGFGKDQQLTSSTPTTARVEEKNSETSEEREEDEERNNSDGPLLETNTTPTVVATTAKENGNTVAPEEVEDDEPELRIAEEDDDDDDEEKNDEARGARSLNDKKRKREQGDACAGELRGPLSGKSPRTDHDHQPHHHQPAPLMRAQAL